jgi:hypothetical protein
MFLNGLCMPFHKKQQLIPSNFLNDPNFEVRSEHRFTQTFIYQYYS